MVTGREVFRGRHFAWISPFLKEAFQRVKPCTSECLIATQPSTRGGRGHPRLQQSQHCILLQLQRLFPLFYRHLIDRGFRSPANWVAWKLTIHCDEFLNGFFSLLSSIRLPRTQRLPNPSSLQNASKISQQLQSRQFQPSNEKPPKHLCRDCPTAILLQGFGSHWSLSLSP